jgi:hypothetical protein
MSGSAVLSSPCADEELVCVCCHCRRVRTETGDWEPRYVSESDEVSHGICRECYGRFYPGRRLPRAAA